MTFTVKLFAAAREMAGAEEVMVETSAGATAGELRRAVAAQWPALAGLIDRSLLAVNAEYAGEAVALAEGDEVALIPPVSGG